MSIMSFASMVKYLGLLHTHMEIVLGKFCKGGPKFLIFLDQGNQNKGSDFFVCDRSLNVLQELKCSLDNVVVAGMLS